MQPSSETSLRAGRALYSEMLAGSDFSPVLQTLIKMDQSLSNTDAERLLQAYLQWVAIIPAVGPGNCLAMLDSPVEKACHAFVLNTRMYQEFCEKYLGFFLHHDPFDGKSMENSDAVAQSTLTLLDSYYGRDLSPVFEQWRSEMYNATYRVACHGWCR